MPRHQSKAKSMAWIAVPLNVAMTLPSALSFPVCAPSQLALLPPPAQLPRQSKVHFRSFRGEKFVPPLRLLGSDDVEDPLFDDEPALEFSRVDPAAAPSDSSSSSGRTRRRGEDSSSRAWAGSTEDGPGATPPSKPDEDRADLLRSTLRRLAELSLEDYEWRAGLFKSNQADRMVETSIARMRGQDPSYVRPMDASTDKLGPLGRLEKAAVDWLSSVFEEEGRRARTIVSQDGQMVRPIEGQVLGPLGFLEKAVVEFLSSIRASEKERARTHTLRPKDLKENRGPLGELEREAVRILTQIEESEALRAQQIRSRGGEIVRPIDVPGPLGDFEMAVSELFQAEKMRSHEKEARGKVVRPKDAKYRGPLGDAEYQAYEAIKQLNQEEMNRLESIQQYMKDNRPMEANRESIWGVLEAIVVGLLRAPQIILSVVSRVAELLSSESMSDADQTILRSRRADPSGQSVDPPPAREEPGV